MSWQLALGQLTNVAQQSASLLPETRSLIARFTTSPSWARTVLINNMIGSLITAGVWAKLDVLYIMAAADTQCAKLNWVTNNYNLVETGGTMPFTPDRGYTPDGIALYLETGFAPASAPSPKYTLNDAHLAAWHLTDLNNAGAVSFDVGNGNGRIVNSASLSTNPRPNNGMIKAIVENYAKYKMWTRANANLWEWYNSGVDTDGGTDASTTLSAAAMQIGRTSSVSYGVNQVSVVHIGSNLTAGEVLAAFNAINTYMQAVGAA